MQTENYKIEQPSNIRWRSVEVVDLNSFARKKDGISFALNLSLFSSNTDQLVTLLQYSSSWNSVQIVDLSLIIFSLGLQLVTFAILAYLSSTGGRVTQERKQRMNRMNTLALILSMITTLINIAIVSFSRSQRSLKSC